MLPPPPRSTLFPYTTLFRSLNTLERPLGQHGALVQHGHAVPARGDRPDEIHVVLDQHDARDRKSTRLNSSHVAISYAVFCLKKKTKKIKTIRQRVRLQ